MIERDFIAQKTKELHIFEYIKTKLPRAGISSIKLKKIPLGEKIIVSTSRPSIVVGSRGANIKDLTRALKRQFKLENPQVEIDEVKDVFLDATIVADQIASFLERFGSKRFKSIGHRSLSNVIKAGALGVEIILSGKIPGSRAKSWRFYEGYLKKCGDISISGVRKAQASAALKSGIIGIKVAIMPPDLILPDHVEIIQEPVQVVEEITSKEDDQVKKLAVKKPTKKKIAAKRDVKTSKQTSSKKSKPVAKKTAAPPKKVEAVQEHDGAVEDQK